MSEFIVCISVFVGETDMHCGDASKTLEFFAEIIKGIGLSYSMPGLVLEMGMIFEGPLGYVRYNESKLKYIPTTLTISLVSPP
jgi:hypothetical protein